MISDVQAQRKPTTNIQVGNTLIIRDGLGTVRAVQVTRVDQMIAGKMLWCTQGFHIQAASERLFTVVE